MSTKINIVPAQEVKRRGIGAIVELLSAGPVHVLQHNRPAFVALREDDYRKLHEELEEARIAASLRDADTGHVRFGTSRDLLDEIVG